MIFLLWRCQLRHINHASINIATSIIGGWRWHGIWRVRWIPTWYWRSFQLVCFVMWRAGWLLTNRGDLRWINYLIYPCRSHRYHQLWQLIYIWVTFLAVKVLVISRSALWRAGLLLTNPWHMRWIDDWIIKWRRNRYHWWWQLFALWVTVFEIGSPIIMRSLSLPTLIFPCSTFVATTNTLWTWHDECNMSLWWFCVPIFCFFMAIKRWEPNFWRDNFSHVWVSVPLIKLVTNFLSQYHPN